VHDIKPRVWRDDEIQLVRDLANRTFPRLERALIEEALRESEQKYRALTELSAHMVWTLTPGGDITYLSKRWFEYTGMSEAEIKGGGWIAALHPDDRERITQEFRQALARDNDYAVELRFRSKDDSYRWHLSRATPIKEANRTLYWLGVTFDIHERKRAEERLEALARVTSSFAQSQTLAEVRGVILNEVLAALGSNGGGLRLVTKEGLVLEEHVRGTHASEATVRQYSYLPFDAQHPACEVAHRGEAVFLKNPDDIIGRYPNLAETVSKIKLRASAHLPLKRGEETFGVLSLSFSQTQTWSKEEQQFALTLADRTAVAYERARLFEEEQRARKQAEETSQRLASLQAVTGHLATALTPADIVKVVLEEGLASLGAKAGTIAVPEGEAMKLLGAQGYSDEVIRHYQRFPVESDVPLAEAFRTGTPLWLRSMQDFVERYDRLPSVNDYQAWATVPLKVNQQVLGGLGLAYSEPQRFDESERSFILTLADLCAQALERARLFEENKFIAKVPAENPNPVLRITLDGHVLYANDAAQPLLAFWQRQRQQSTIPEELRTLIQEAFASANKKVTELPFNERTLAFTLAPILEAGYVNLYGTDITERKKAEHHLRLLSEASTFLASSLDLEVTLHNAAHALVPQFADWCVIDLLEAGGGIKAATFAHAEPDKIRWAKELRARYPLDPKAQAGAPNVIRTGKSEFYPEIPDALLQSVAKNEEELALLRSVGYSSVMVVPLLVRGQAIGAVTLVMTESGRHFNQADLTLAEELARRCAAAIDNASLYTVRQQSDTRLRLALEAGNMGAWDWDISKNSYFWDAGQYAIFGVRPENFVISLEAIWASTHPEDRERLKALAAHALDTGEPYQAEFRIVRPDGEVRWCVGGVAITQDAQGKAVRMSGITFDITERKKLELELREADKRKDEFLATLGHELRNPLSPIRTSLEIMKRTKDETVQQEARETIERQTSQMVHLIDDLLDVSRITRGKINLKKERVVLTDIIKMAAESSETLIEDRNHTLTVALPPKPVVLLGDKTRLSQIILNLLTNAAKYTPPGGTIKLSARLEGSEVVITVDDNGIGIPEAMLDKVFEMFTRVERQESYQQQGLGIGLSLVKQLVGLHEGSIAVSSLGEGKGSTFTVRLPIIIEEAKPEPRRLPLAATQKPNTRRVLVVDDYEPNLKTMSRMLKLMGHEVATAANGPETLECLEAFKPDIILLDINMPGMSGYEVARRVREHPDHAGIKLVAVTGYGQDEDVQRAKAAGFDEHLVKPVDVGKLEQVLKAQNA
jgi:PAS domain S-box-containing protein